MPVKKPNSSKRKAPVKGKKRGPKVIKVDWSQIDGMCKIQCTQEEIASVMGCSLDTLERRCLEDKKVKFAEYFREKKIGGKASLRRTQWLMAQKTPSLAIFLGKNYLGQTDKNELTGKDSGPLVVTLSSEDERI